jgi:hypothetical protein
MLASASASASVLASVWAAAPRTLPLLQRAGGTDGHALRLDADLCVDVADRLLRHAPRVPHAGEATEWAALPLSSHLELAASAAPRVPSQFAWVERDTRAFWYSAGAGGLLSLGIHLFGGIPAVVFGATWLGVLASSGSPATLAIGLGLFSAYVVAEAAASSLVATLVFNSLSSVYEGHFSSAFFGHLLGVGAATAIGAVTFGGGMVLFHGLGVLTEFTGSAGVSGIQVFSLLGALPAVVVVGAALVVLPAVASSYALAAGATARPGYEIDEQWQRPAQAGRVFDPTRAAQMASVASMVTLPLP